MGNTKDVIAIIPARGGSVRIPRKNVKLLNGKPLIAYAIEAAKNSNRVNRVIVSTDDDEIKKVALEFGAEVPFKRPADISEDVPTEEVILHVIDWLQKNESYSPDIVVTLEPPVPFRNSDHIDQCVDAILDNDQADSAITVFPVKGFRPEWMVRLNDKNIVSPYTSYFKQFGEAVLRFPASQIFEPLFKTCGLAIACEIEAFRSGKSLVGERCVGIKVKSEDCFDLDHPGDFEMCEILIKNRE